MTQVYRTERDDKNVSVVEDFHGKEYIFIDNRIAELFGAVDKMEDGIREKYFDDDIEFEQGTKLAKKMKGQLRRMDVDLKKLIDINFEGIDDDQ